MKEVITRVEELAVELNNAKRTIEEADFSIREHAEIRVQLVQDGFKASAEIRQLRAEVSKLQTERDRILEISKSLVPKSALKQAVQEAAELSAEVAKLRAEVPLESTREALKNATAKIAELTAQLDSAKGEAEEWNKQCHAARRQRDEVKAEARKETQRLGDECARLAGKVAELEAQKSDTQLLSKYESLLTKITDLGSYAMTLGRKEGEPLEMFMERQSLRLAMLESKASPRDALEMAMEREYAIMKAQHEPLKRLFRTLDGICKDSEVSVRVGDIYNAVAEARSELVQLTA